MGRKENGLCDVKSESSASRSHPAIRDEIR